MLFSRKTYFSHHLAEVDDEPTEDLRLREVLLHEGLLLTDDPDGETRTRKRMAMGELGCQTQIVTQNPDLSKKIKCLTLIFN